MTTSLSQPKDFWHPRIGRFRAGGGWYRVAIREKVTVLHNDRDYEVLARHTLLRTERYRALRIVPSH